MKMREAAVAYLTRPMREKIEAEKRKAKIIPIHQWSSFDKIEAIKTGISKEELESLKNKSQLDYEALSVILNVTKATLHNKKGKEKFDQYISERIFLLAELYSYGYEIFGNHEKFNTWMKKENRSLNWVSPLSFMDTLYGIGEVKQLIGRIAYGIIS